MTPRQCRLWGIVLALYALIALVDMGVHLREGAQSGQKLFAPANLTVAFSAGLFWPADLVARLLLGR